MRVAAVLWMAMIAGGSAGAQGAATDRIKAVVQSIDVPAGERVALRVEARGVQIYRCEQKGRMAGWNFAEPEAQLFVNDRLVGTHGAGPSWHLQSGSAVWGEVLAKRTTVDEGAIPMLLLKVVRSQGGGELEGVNFIQRLETKGGVARPGECAVGGILKVPYAAVYVFYRSER